MLQVLIVEDLASNRTVASYHLQKLGCDTETANDGVDAVEKCKETRFDMIFMDLDMPIMDGFTALKHIQEEDNPNNRTPIVALTADDRSEKEEYCMTMGFHGVITKPINRDQLEQALDRWIF